MVTIKDVEKAFNDVYLLADKGVIRLVMATVIANRLTFSDKPVWLLLIAPSSGGKTMIMQSLDYLGKWIIPVDTLTTNTFASGFRALEDVSLLDKANGGIIVFKDFTTLTSMNKDGLDEIMGQFRAIYDGSFNKKTGTGVNIDWKGKVGIIAGGTVAVQRKLRQYSEQGERFVNYIIKQPDRVEMTRRAILNQKNMKQKEEDLKNIVLEFITTVINRAYEKEIDLTDDLVNDMIQVANFSTLARSPVILNRQSGKLEWVPEAEMPSRMATKFTNLAVALSLLHEDGQLDTLDKDTVYKTAFDSVPADRRLALQVLTKHSSATTKSLAISLNYPTETVRGWCVQLNALGMVERSAGSRNSDKWTLKREFREAMSKFEKIDIKDEELTVSKEAEEIFDSHVEHNRPDPTDEELLNQMDFGAFND